MGSKAMITRIGLLGLVALFAVQDAQAAVTAQEAQKLKSELTPWGAERAGNKDGTIPAWNGGLKAPAGYKPGDPRAPVHPEDKVQFSISSKNMDKYKDKLSANLMALMAKYPDFRIDVYPTRRTASYPDWAVQQTLQNATRTTTTNDGLTVVNAFGGPPFPIPKTGREVMWNGMMRFSMPEFEYIANNWAVTANGERILLSQVNQRWYSPMFDPALTAEDYQKNSSFFQLGRSEFIAPPVKNGEMQLIRVPADTYTYKNDIWQYLAGQRRLRKAPNLNYDAPNPNTSGMSNVDESYGVAGPLDRFDVTLLGKKEMYVPYNNNNLVLMSPDKIVQPKFPNPEAVRWELHRVWVVEMKIKEGQRNTVPHRIVYVDEDSWNFTIVDSFSADGKPWKVTYMPQYVCADVGVVGIAGSFGVNLQNGSYLFEADISGSPKPLNAVPRSPATYYTPDSLAAAGVR
ncbi:DUF1329 domain-containing protein [Azospirillum sp. INR13]|nr:DUF1329 domain-containing protein [Azospirillum sp. INR13]